MSVAGAKEGIPREANIPRALGNGRLAGLMREFEARDPDVFGRHDRLETVRTTDLDSTNTLRADPNGLLGRTDTGYIDWRVERIVAVLQDNSVTGPAVPNL